MSALLKMTIGEIVARRPQAAAVFEILGIDYSCHGGLTLHDACAATGLDPLQVRQSLEQLPRDEHDVNWLEQPLTALTHYLAGDLHEQLREARVTLAARLSDDCARCEVLHEQTARLRHEFAVVSQTLDVHFATELRVLFPLLEHFDDCWSRGVAAERQSARGISFDIQTLVIEHGRMIDSVELLHSVVDDVMIGDDPCLEVVEAVRAFDRAIREHVHLANNVLFPRAIALETIMTETSLHAEVTTR